MAHDYQSFLVRYWQLGDGTRRIAVEHVQSGEKTLVPTLEAATVWLSICVGDNRHEASPPTEESGVPPDTPPPRAPYSLRGEY